MKIYTKTGDTGKTSLYDGRRIDKASVVFDVIGEVDELNARLGVAAVACKNNCIVSTIIREIQCKTQDINSILATIDKTGKTLPSITEDDVTALEKRIDDYSMVMPKLTAFILPGVSELDAHLHMCRTQARKCERALFNLNRCEDVLLDHKNREVDIGGLTVDPVILKYVNRLSDFLFALARYTCHVGGCKDAFVKDYV